MREYIDIGPTPADEPCAQIGEDDYTSRAVAECRRYARLINRAYPGACAVVVPHRHDYGTYYEVAVKYDDADIAQAELAYRIEETLPLTWAELETMAEEQTQFIHKETGSTDTKAGWRLSYPPDELETRGRTANQALTEDIGKTLFPANTTQTKETTKKETTMHDLNSVLIEGEIRVSPIYTEHPDGLTARFIIASTRRPKDADPVTVTVPVVAQGRLSTMLRDRWTPVTCIRAVGRLIPDTQPDTAPLAILAEHIEYRT